AHEKSKDYRALRQGEIAETILVIDPESTEARSALRTLLKLLSDDRPDNNGCRLAGARALGRCGSVAATARPELVKRLRDKDWAVRVETAEALLLTGGEKDETGAVFEVFSSGLAATDAWDRRETARAIGRLGPLARAALPALKKARDDPDPQVQQAVESAIARVEARGCMVARL